MSSIIVVTEVLYIYCDHYSFSRRPYHSILGTFCFQLVTISLRLYCPIKGCVALSGGFLMTLYTVSLLSLISLLLIKLCLIDISPGSTILNSLPLHLTILPAATLHSELPDIHSYIFSHISCFWSLI